MNTFTRFFAARFRPRPLGLLAAALAASFFVQQVHAWGRPPPRPLCPPIPRVITDACGEAVHNDMPRNDMPRNDMPRNGLSTPALAANRQLLALLASKRLDSALVATAHASGWLTPSTYAPHLLKYVASCALDPCEKLATPAGDELLGGLGLCGDKYNTWAAANGRPSEVPWKSGPPSKACLERVSACVLARTNAIGSSVLFSMRGDGTKFQERVNTEPIFRENHGTPIVSFRSCAASCLWGDLAHRNCDWQARFVGQCPAGSNVRLAATHPSDKARIRVCAGIHGCDSYALAAGPTTVPKANLPRYGGLLIKDGNASFIDFVCPSNGPPVQGTPTGYYSVMLSPPTSTATLSAGADLSRVDPAGNPVSTPTDAYPAKEEAVFTYREGSFYGTLFSKDGVRPGEYDCRTEMLSGHQFVCYSSNWQAGAAMFAHRLCAGLTSLTPTGCFANPPAPCDNASIPGVCKPQLPLVADMCTGKGTGWERPYTAYLNHPCDLYATDEECLAHLDRKRVPEVKARSSGGAGPKSHVDPKP